MEGFQYAAPQAWEAQSGRDMDEFPVHQLTDVAREPRGTPWEEDELEARYPRLAAKFG